MIDVKPPVLIFKKGNKNLYSYEYAFLADRSLISFYKDTTVIDSNGNSFDIESAKRKGGIKFLQSLKSLSLMVEVEPKVKSTQRLSLEEIKGKVFEHVTKHSKHWLVLDTLEGMKSRIYSAKSFEELFRIFK